MCLERQGNNSALFKFPNHKKSKGVYNFCTPEVSSVLYETVRKLWEACCESLIQG